MVPLIGHKDPGSHTGVAVVYFQSRISFQIGSGKYLNIKRRDEMSSQTSFLQLLWVCFPTLISKVRRRVWWGQLIRMLQSPWYPSQFSQYSEAFLLAWNKPRRHYLWDRNPQPLHEGRGRSGIIVCFVTWTPLDIMISFTHLHLLRSAGLLVSDSWFVYLALSPFLSFLLCSWFLTPLA